MLLTYGSLVNPCFISGVDEVRCVFVFVVCVGVAELRSLIHVYLWRCWTRTVVCLATTGRSCEQDYIPEADGDGRRQEGSSQVCNRKEMPPYAGKLM